MSRSALTPPPKSRLRVSRSR